MSKKIQLIQDQANYQIQQIEEEMTKKAEKQVLLESQQKFFEQMTRMETDSDKSLSKLVGEEIRKLSE